MGDTKPNWDFAHLATYFASESFAEGAWTPPEKRGQKAVVKDTYESHYILDKWALGVVVTISDPPVWTQLQWANADIDGYSLKHRGLTHPHVLLEVPF
eukprot:Em0013g967a